MAKTVMFIHGAWLTPRIWSAWQQRFEAAGYETVAPAWPYLDRPLNELRLSPARALGQLSVGKIVDHYAGLIEAMPEPPVLVGHSFGGLVVQMLLDRGLGAAGIAIDPAPARGVLPGLAAVMTSFPILSAWAGWSRVFRMSREAFARNFAGGLRPNELEAAYERHIVPAPGRPFYQAALGIGTGIRWGNPERPPLFLMAGERDRTVEAGMVRQALGKYRRKDMPAEFRLWKDRSHFLIAERGWEEVADSALEWIGRIVPASPASTVELMQRRPASA